MSTWTVSEAKAKLSEVIDKARNEPQTILNRGHKVAVILEAAQFESLENELKSLKQLMKRQRIRSAQEKMRRSCEEAGIDQLVIETTPARPLPSFEEDE